MIYKVRFLPGALEDLRRHSKWYEERKIGLGSRFERSIIDQTKLLERTPSAYRIVHRDIHRCSVPKFPYELYFRVTEDLVIIVAVHGVRQDSDALKAKLDVI